MYKKHCNKIRKKYRADYKEKLRDIKDMSQYVNSITKPKTPNIGTVKRSDGSYSLPGEETLKALADIHFPGHSKDLVHPRATMAPTIQEVEDSCNDWIDARK